MEYGHEQQRLTGESRYNQTIEVPGIQEIAALTEVVITEIDWLLQVIDFRIEELKDGILFSFSDHPPPVISDDRSSYNQIIRKFDLDAMGRLLLICSIIPHVSPEVLTEKMRDKNNHLKLLYPEFGGFIDPLFYNYTITRQTILFLLAGTDKTHTFFHKLTLNNSALVKEGIITFEASTIDHGADNELNKIPVIAKEYLFYLESGHEPRPDYGSSFPARLVTTEMGWEHLILDEHTEKHIRELMLWVEYGKDLLQAGKVFGVSYPCLFYGPPGTGKSLTAKLIGKKYSKHVFRVDLSMIVSKYIGETEKNLARLFDRAQGKDWILFFDEADALFSKRTKINSSQDKWANLEVNYLLQRMEEHQGLTILATNLKDNIDPAMTRRFQSIIYFPLPKEKERKRLWNTLLPAPFSYDPSIRMEKLASMEFSGANIANILKLSCLFALKNATYQLNYEWIENGIRRELVKENKTL